MRSSAKEERNVASSDRSPPGAGSLSSLGTAVVSFFAKTFALVAYDARKIRHDPTDLLTRAVQPALWLLVFGEVFTRAHVIPTSGLPYLDFLAPGILAQSVMFISIFYGIQTIWERDLGIVYKFVASPTPRSALVLGKGLGGGLRGLSQAAVVFALSIVLGVHLNSNPLNVVGILGVAVLMAVLFVSFSTIVASIVKTQERFMGIGQLLTMPLFFASSAIYPISVMPSWLKPVAYANPLTYAVDALRSLMVLGGGGSLGLPLDLAALGGTTVALLLVGAWLYPRMAQ